MGGAGLTTLSDSETLYYNPAALANIQTTFWDIASLQTEWNRGGYRLVKSIYEKGRYSDATEDYVKLLKDSKNSQIFVKGKLESAFYHYILDRGMVWGIGYAGEFSFNIVFDDETDIGSFANIRQDNILQTGMSIPFGLGSYVLGIGFRSVERVEATFEYKLSDATTDKSVPNVDPSKSITGFGYDVGLMYRMPHPSRFKATVVGQNIGGIRFKKDDLEYSEQKEEISAGISVSPVYQNWNFKFALDYRDLTGKFFKDENEALKRLHVGMEIGHVPVDRTFNLFAVRAGLYKGNRTFGIEANFGLEKNLVLGYANYVEEIGPKLDEREDVRHVIYLSVGF